MEASEHFSEVIGDILSTLTGSMLVQAKAEAETQRQAAELANLNLDRQDDQARPSRSKK